MSIKKSYPKDKPYCKVTFQVPGAMANGSDKVLLVGDFNQWDLSTQPMRLLKSGSFKKTLQLETGKEYQFRYLIGDGSWQNDPDADKHVPSPYYDAENSVVIT